MRTTLLIDTNILIDDPHLQTAPWCLRYYKILICKPVLHELDAMKSRKAINLLDGEEISRDRGNNARWALKTIDAAMTGRKSLPDGGVMRMTQIDATGQTTDERIVLIGLEHQRQHPDEHVIFFSRDAGARVIAHQVGLDTIHPDEHVSKHNEEFSILKYYLGSTKPIFGENPEIMDIVNRQIDLEAAMTAAAQSNDPDGYIDRVYHVAEALLRQERQLVGSWNREHAEERRQWEMDMEEKARLEKESRVIEHDQAQITAGTSQGADRSELTSTDRMVLVLLGLMAAPVVLCKLFDLLRWVIFR